MKSFASLPLENDQFPLDLVDLLRYSHVYDTDTDDDLPRTEVPPMSRITNEQRIAEAWKNTDQVWPPAIGDKLRLFQPKDCRGRVVKVIAVGDQKAKNSTRLAPEGKARIVYKDQSGTTHQFAVHKYEVFPKEYTLKQLQNIIN